MNTGFIPIPMICPCKNAGNSFDYRVLRRFFALCFVFGDRYYEEEL